MKFNYAAHAGPEAACVNPLHACRISNTHLNPPSPPPSEAQGRQWAEHFPQREWMRCLSLCGRRAKHTTLIKTEQ